MSGLSCHACKADAGYDPRFPLGRSSSCPRCGADLRCCLNCRHYDRNARYECRESSVPERVADKSRGNFCDWFQPQLGPSAGSPAPSSRDDLRKAAEALFKKK